MLLVSYAKLDIEVLSLPYAYIWPMPCDAYLYLLRVHLLSTEAHWQWKISLSCVNGKRRKRWLGNIVD